MSQPKQRHQRTTSFVVNQVACISNLSPDQRLYDNENITTTYLVRHRRGLDIYLLPVHGATYCVTVAANVLRPSFDGFDLVGGYLIVAAAVLIASGARAQGITLLRR